MILNLKNYGIKKPNHIKENKKELDFNTFNDELAISEINRIKEIIKDAFKFKHVYTYQQIQESVLDNYTKEQIELFDDLFIKKALTMLLPTNENSFNNFKDVITDKYENVDYMTQRNKYYIFQPINENEKVPMYYRESFDKI